TAALVAQGTPALKARAGLYHFSATGVTTWFGFAKAIVGDVTNPVVTGIATADFPTPARRPAYGVLDTSLFTATFGFAQPSWEDSLAACLADGRRA
ncbi:MAG: sugar nucleotide-binding protein, partial [Betaproteobacteria bacterium]